MIRLEPLLLRRFEPVSVMARILDYFAWGMNNIPVFVTSLFSWFRPVAATCFPEEADLSANLSDYKL